MRTSTDLSDMEKSVGAGVWILVCLLAISRCSASSDPSDMDPSIRLPVGHHIKQSLFAVGFQIYNFNGTGWALKNVSADLFDFKGRRVGFHYFLQEKDSNGGQATWETFKPESRVTAKVVALVPEPDAIPFVLLEFTSRSGDMRRLGAISFVQRLFTHKGLPPIPSASAETAKIGDVYKSYYTALYTFASPQEAHN